ncbi:alpha/beta hydrolase fold domain-containing protein [Kitasatospora brasiliensis]|uniref:alpha/beta hydrolase fold domain-containing protein n=1 Tax=Kitasatospora brasiliensis TaxID=3058040 RepID=UPI00292CBD70|nr:alpha/beta hydrolase fold domain-containing protein [Kitasatospora sp. K002]
MTVAPSISVPLPMARALLHPFYRLTFHQRMPWSVQRTLLNGVARFQPLPAGVRVETLRLGDRPAERVSAGPFAGPGAVLYLHGGGYTVGSPATHRSLAAHLAAGIRRPVYLLDYRLAPEHPCPAALEDALAAFDALTRTPAHEAGSIALAGDSAGGAIALAAAQHLVAHRRRPAALALLSPWTDPGERAERHRDLVVNRDWGLACAAAYRGDIDPLDHRFAPLLGPMEGLPPTYLFTSTRELVYAQCLRLAGSLRRAGVELRYVESPVLWHAAQAQAGLVRQAAESLGDVGEFLVANWS